jgi:hypothetical protein
MKNKVISFVLWLLIWWTVVYGYDFFMNNRNTSYRGQTQNQSWTRGSFDPSQMSDEQLQRMADRAWVSVEEMKKRFESWEGMRNGWSFRRGSGSVNREGENLNWDESKTQ